MATWVASNKNGQEKFKLNEDFLPKLFSAHFSLSCIAEVDGNPLQCSCLENPRDWSLVGCRLWGHTESDTTDMT